jgi:23S rRNA G2069 N7-methylase RlmK/C1962 C5-methylase RlmI
MLDGRQQCLSVLDVLRLPEVTDAWRVVHAEGDGITGLMVDRYGPVAVVATAPPPNVSSWRMA